MTLQLYDLALSDIDVRPSPYCWLVKYALLHKGLKFETIPLRFTEKENYPDPEHGQLPILKDGDQVICDSLNIIAYLEKHHANDPLTSTKGERAAVDFYLA
ncbi:MAG: glutathione S-transferase family protein, partial [Alphaproteobacteria bacterium]|nr:glutathione S-transferase family protein [Alphaproteobacteria bacterium]